MEFTINSKKYGPVTFSRPGPYYIYVNLNGKSGILGQQICDYGCLLGSAIGTTHNDQEDFERICRRWWAAYLRKY